ncbi:MAG: NapC/NirT family cytochrome c [Planctomycetota bacterium]|jgi:nitrate/TMAO reductase-like tetraheme cytochrome c subunit
MTDVPNDPESTSSTQPSDTKSKLRRWLKRLGVLALVAVVLVAILGIGAEYYTSRPQFCGSCHIMGPYYQGWTKDVHSYRGKAACVDCHYAPGQQHTFKAKFRGLSQLTSYFSGRAGTSRPKAHVNDTSCLLSECHGDRKFMTKELKLGNVTFTHTKHLDPESQMLIKKQNQLDQLRKKLVGQIGSEHLKDIEELARNIQHAEQRGRHVTTWLTDRALLPFQEDILAYAELLHAEVRIHQLGGLKCASCHQFESSIHKKHFSVNKTTCYTCHFINQSFNTYTGRCMGCHEPPAGPIPVHATKRHDVNDDTSVPPAQVTMDHSLIVANKVNCEACHADLIRGGGEVTIENCQDCHDQERYLKDLNKLTTEVVREYHRIHAAGQHARCNDCHLLIQHRLTLLAETDDMTTLLKPVRQDCQHCHPEHHREQTELLLGQGGFVTDALGGPPNQMMGLRVNCRGCHSKGGADAKGEIVITGTAESCRGCHSDEYMELFVRWQRSIEARLNEAMELLDKAEKRMTAITTQPDRESNQANQLLLRAKHNIKLVHTANGIHNKNYALTLLDQAIIDLEKILKSLTG